MRPLIVLATVLVGLTIASRPKIKDIDGHKLIPFDEIASSCADSYTGYAIIDDSLEKCDNYTALQLGRRHAVDYEKFKCSHLRVNGEMRNNKCVCKKMYKGPICNDGEGCEPGHSLFKGVCTPNACQHEGKMAIGTKGMECICNDHWDGKFCDRLACWRLTVAGQDKRYRNDKATNSCVCGSHYTGEKCDVITQCEHGELQNQVCVCKEGYGGEICQKKCPHGEVTCSSSILNGSLLFLTALFAFFTRQ